jgi:hypothetical protein
VAPTLGRIAVYAFLVAERAAFPPYDRVPPDLSHSLLFPTVTDPAGADPAATCHGVHAAPEPVPRTRTKRPKPNAHSLIS